MKQLFKIWALAALILLPGLAFPQSVIVKGYADVATQSGGDTRLAVSSDGKTTTMTLANLFAYGEALANVDGSGKQQAVYGSNPDYFKGGKVYALRLGKDWHGGRTAAQVDLNAKGILAEGTIGDNQVILVFPSEKGGSQPACQPLTYLLVKADGKRAWLGHSGYKASNTAPGIGDHLVLANNDRRFPATVVCFDAKGKVVPLTPELRAELAKTIQPPAGATEATARAQQD